MITGPTATLKRARQLRSEMSLPEVILWRELRKRPGDFKFRRQHAARLAVEVDGFAHDSERAARSDAARSHFLRSQGVATLRVPAKAVLNDLEAAVIRIVEVCGMRVETLAQHRHVPLHHPADGPPPPVGEDLS